MKKCLNCGNVFLELHSYPTIAVGNHFNAYVCANCVHIDFYVSVDEIKGISKIIYSIQL